MIYEIFKIIKELKYLPYDIRIYFKHRTYNLIYRIYLESLKYVEKHESYISKHTREIANEIPKNPCKNCGSLTYSFHDFCNGDCARAYYRSHGYPNYRNSQDFGDFVEVKE